MRLTICSLAVIMLLAASPAEAAAPKTGHGRKSPGPEHKVHMQTICASCHGQDFADVHFVQFEATARVYDERFADTASRILDAASERPEGLPETATWTFWELWNDDRYGARHGAPGEDSSGGLWWAGFTDVALSFYEVFVPAMRATGEPAVSELIARLVDEDSFHAANLQAVGVSVDAFSENFASTFAEALRQPSSR